MAGATVSSDRPPVDEARPPRRRRRCRTKSAAGRWICPVPSTWSWPRRGTSPRWRRALTPWSKRSSGGVPLRGEPTPSSVVVPVLGAGPSSPSLVDVVSAEGSPDTRSISGTPSVVTATWRSWSSVHVGTARPGPAGRARRSPHGRDPAGEGTSVPLGTNDDPANARREPVGANGSPVAVLIIAPRAEGRFCGPTVRRLIDGDATGGSGRYCDTSSGRRNGHYTADARRSS